MGREVEGLGEIGRSCLPCSTADPCSWLSLDSVKKEKEKSELKTPVSNFSGLFLQQRPMEAWKGWRTGREVCAVHAL